MKVGITLPQFRDEADTALEAARRAEELGPRRGVLLRPSVADGPARTGPRSSSAPLLGALAASTSTISVGTLVARVGLVPDEVLVAVVSSLSVISRGRMIAGIGTGDQLSRPENVAFGVPFESADKRRSRVAVGRLPPCGIWASRSGSAGGCRRPSSWPGSSGSAVNLWEAEPLRVAELTATGMEVTWGGPVGASVPEAAARLGRAGRGRGHLGGLRLARVARPGPGGELAGSAAEAAAADRSG